MLLRHGKDYLWLCIALMSSCGMKEPTAKEKAMQVSLTANFKASKASERKRNVELIRRDSEEISEVPEVLQVLI